ncbi:MAG: HAD family hydrolase [Acidobacteria bacterium]|nr:HAD family hydrolase [Acidobacteriota bacterium]
MQTIHAPGYERRAVVFDLYGTLLDIRVNETSRSLWDALARHFRARGHDVVGPALRRRYDAAMRAALQRRGEGFVLDHVFQNLLETAGRRPTTGEIRDFAGIFRRCSTRRFRVRPYVKPLLRRLRRGGLKLALVSNTEALLTEYDLARSSLNRLFDAVVLSSAVGVKKPDPRIFRLALRRLGVRPAEAVFVGDDLHVDIEGARRTGMGVLPVTSRRCTLAALGRGLRELGVPV